MKNVLKNILGFLILLNLVAIDYWIYTYGIQNPKNLETSRKPTFQKTVTTSVQSCPQSCISYIQEATASSVISQTTTGQVTAKPLQKEFFVPIGSGTNSSSDWEDVAGLQVIVDTAQYGKIKNAYFEASVNVPSGNEIVYVRLYNVTDKHPVWFSELTFLNANTAQQLTSDNITLDSGNKAYKVQMKTQLKISASLNSSRIRIITQ